MAARSGASRSGKLSAWLASLSDDELAELLRARPDTLLAPLPPGFGDLANRLTIPHSVRAAMASLTLAGLRLLEGILVLGPEATRERLHALFGGPEALSTDRMAEALTELRRLGLVWPNGERLAAPAALRQLMPHPLALGRPAHQLLDQLTVDALRRIGESHGLRRQPTKAAWVAALNEALADRDAVRRRLAELSPRARALVEEIAWHGPVVGGVSLPPPGRRARQPSPGEELALGGWMVTEPWTAVGEMPREVALAVRGPEYHPSFPAPPDPLASQPVDPDRLRAAAQRAAEASVDGMSRLLGLLGQAPLATVQAGGVGVRELRRAGKALRCEEQQVRLWLEVAALGELVTVADGEVVPTETADRWLRAAPSVAWAGLVATWWVLPVTPSHRLDAEGKAQPALGGRLFGVPDDMLRADLLELLASAGPAASVRNLDELPIRLAWRRPLAYGDPTALGAHVAAALREFAALGLVAEDALTPLGVAWSDALTADDRASALAKAADGLLAAPTSTAVFLPDLTAVVAGNASVELATLLDSCADVESRDVASTWRFSPASVRRALDAGQSAEEVLSALAAVADKPLPQPLTYLVHDIARQHGRLRVRAVACCVCVADAALAAELAGTRSLAALRLTRLSDTVLSSAKSVPETLAALRAAGFAPIREDGSGRTVVERVSARRAKPPRRPRYIAGATAAPLKVRPEALVAELRRQAPRSGAEAPGEPLFDLMVEPSPAGSVVSLVREAAELLTDGEVAVLADAIEGKRPVRIDYLGASERMTSRVVEPIELDEDLLRAWCRLRDDERTFRLGRIASVHPVAG